MFRVLDYVDPPLFSKLPMSQPFSIISRNKEKVAIHEHLESETTHHTARHPLPVAQPLFPSPLLAVIPMIIEMLDDPQVDKNGVSGA
ncbi:hypothetical protein ANCDUO_05142 [Ancylostoma duodenale]|uniref:Uncharacterized protein n=1 Tax=Ancylostoma duodenale TaxID=51022 RepID=A0A0C2D4T9_9BILA|nr:hypothetical protein ANCDUO_05142 [Ancylostoma duodenale]